MIFELSIIIATCPFQNTRSPALRSFSYLTSFVTNEVKYEKDLKAGDLVFWKGHVAMMIDNLNIIHANAFHMKTAIEPLATAKKRILKSNGKIKKLGRL